MSKLAVDSPHSLTIRRVINAPRQRVFDAWTQPAHLVRWFRANPAWTTPIAEVDLRVGGKYRLGMRDPAKAAPHIAFGEFQVIEPPHRLVYTWSFEQPCDGQAMPAPMTETTLVTVEFHERGNATEIVLRHERFPDADLAARHTHGWNACIDRLADLFVAV